MTAADSAALEIRRLGSRDEAGVCARMMASSEPWITLRRDARAALAILTDPGRESYVAILEGEIVGELRDYIVAGHSEILMRKSTDPLSPPASPERRTTLRRGDPRGD